MTLSNVVRFPGITKAPWTPEHALDAAKGHQFERVLIIGVDENGKQSIFASDTDYMVAMFDLDRAKAWVLREVMDKETGEQE